MVVVAAIDLPALAPACGSSTVGVRPNSPAPDDERLVQQPALLEILDQRGDRLIALLRPAGDGSTSMSS